VPWTVLPCKRERRGQQLQRAWAQYMTEAVTEHTATCHRARNRVQVEDLVEAGHRVTGSQGDRHCLSPLGLVVEGDAALGRQQLKVEVEEGEYVVQGSHSRGPVETKTSKHAQHLQKVLSGERGGGET
jgi:hypothetical protein